jgi:predicted AlkP superfamily phosphohydrolase/phosphomutase
MPHLQELIDAGTQAPLRTLKPTISPALWTTIATGKAFGKHGIDSFFRKIPLEDGRLVRPIMHMTSNMRKTKALWNIVSDEGGRVAFVGWWVTWPAEPVNGYMVSSYVPLSQTGRKGEPTKGTLSSDREQQTWPPRLFDEVRPLIRDSESVTLEEATRFMTIGPEDLARDTVEGFRWAYAADETYRAAARLILDQNRDIELVGIYFNGIDVVGHRYWRFMEPEAYPSVVPGDIGKFGDVIDRYYEYTDELLGELAARLGPDDTILIVSDHGFHAHGHKDAPDGIFVASGHRISRSAEIEPPELVDITPTVLALLGLPAARDMDGRVLDEIFTTEWHRSYPRERIETYDTAGWQEQRPIPSEADEGLFQRLKKLGYVE